MVSEDRLVVSCGQVVRRGRSVCPSGWWVQGVALCQLVMLYTWNFCVFRYNFFYQVKIKLEAETALAIWNSLCH